MSREIKFRAWHAETKSKIDWKTICQHHDLCELIKSRHVTEQFTGLKDKNGVEIYEGDIVEINGYNSREGAWIKYFEVVWDDVGFCLKRRGKLYGFGVKYDNGNHRKELVIGNIHENPELLEKQNG